MGKENNNGAEVFAFVLRLSIFMVCLMMFVARRIVCQFLMHKRMCGLMAVSEWVWAFAMVLF